jgi:hypothetical protein
MRNLCGGPALYVSELRNTKRQKIAMKVIDEAPQGMLVISLSVLQA